MSVDVQNLIDWLELVREHGGSMRVDLKARNKHGGRAPDLEFTVDPYVLAAELEELQSKAAVYDSVMKAAGDLGRNLRGEL